MNRICGQLPDELSRSLLFGRYSIGADEIGSHQSADDPDTLLNQIDRRSLKLELVTPAKVATQVKSAAIPD